MHPPSRPLQFLAFDFGLKRTGVASGNTVLGEATPLTTVRAEGDARFALIARLIAEWRPDALVVGIPRHPDGAPHENTARAQRFARQLHGRFRLPVHEVDERYSTTEARALGAADLDATSAALLLAQHLRSLQPPPPPSEFGAAAADAPVPGLEEAAAASVQAEMRPVVAEAPAPGGLRAPASAP